MKRIALVLALSTALLGPGCGTESAPAESVAAPPARTSSALVLTAPPETRHAGRYVGWVWNTKSDSLDIWFDKGSSEETLTLPGATGGGILYAALMPRDDQMYLVAGVVDADETYAVYRLHDDTGDGLIDVSTQTLLFDSGTQKLYGTHLAEDADGNMWILDARCQDVWYAADSNADGWADDLGATPFARSSDHAFLLDALSLTAAAPDAVAAYRTGPKAAFTRNRGTYVRYEDTDADGEEDLATAYGAEPERPLVRGVLQADIDDLVVYHEQPAAAGKTAEIWEVDADGDDVALLGSAVIASATLSATISFASSLTEGTFLTVRWKDEPASQEFFTVSAALPVIIETSPRRLLLNTATTLTLKGQSFSSGTAVTLRTKDGATSSLTVTYVDSKTLTVAVPALAAALEGAVQLWATESGQELDVDGAHPRTVLLCPAPE